MARDGQQHHRVSNMYLRNTSIVKLQSSTTFNAYIAKSRFYIACLNNYMFRPLYRPSSCCTLCYSKANCTKYNVFVFVDEISLTFVKFYNLMMADTKAEACTC